MGPPRPVTPMGILAATLTDLCKRHDAGADPGLADDLRRAAELAAGLDPYLESCTTPESSALHTLSRRTAEEDWGRRSESSVHLEQEMLSGQVEGQLLAMLVHATRATRVLEVGMFTGYSALAMAEALPVDGVVVACEIDAEVAALAQRCFEESLAGHRIDVRVGPAAKTLRELAAAGERFDLVFVDADKAGYADYLDVLLETDLLSPHALICVDNTLMQGEPWASGPPGENGAAIAAFNRAVAGDARVAQVLVPLRDGLTLIRRLTS